MRINRQKYRIHCCMWDCQCLQQVTLLYVTDVIPSFPRKQKQLVKLKVILLRLCTHYTRNYILSWVKEKKQTKNTR